MKSLKKLIDKMAPLFGKDGKLEKFYPAFEAAETILFSTNTKTRTGPHIRDNLDIKRLMTLVIIALIPATLFGIYNTGYQSFLAKGMQGGFWDYFLSGMWTVMPIILVSYIAGGFWEVLFAIVRKHEINEGFLVTGILFALVLPPTTPLWMVAVSVSFGVVIGKEVFGGTGMNILNPALTGRAFLFFTYPAHISGDKVWTAIDYAKDKLIDGYSGATPLLVATSTERGQSAVQAVNDASFSWMDMFLGFIPGSIGETSTLAILLGALFLVITGVGSWRIMVSMAAGGFLTVLLFNAFAGPASPGIFQLPPHYHLVMGGFAFGAVFMATDPVSAAGTNTGKWIYGFLIGVLAILIRAVNPAYPEGVMLAILFMNVFAPLIDYYVVRANIRRRLSRA